MNPTIRRIEGGNVSGPPGADVVLSRMLGKEAPEAKFRLDARVRKSTMGHATDCHSAGTLGTVRGSAFSSHFGFAAYLVEFDGDKGDLTFITEPKLEAV